MKKIAVIGVKEGWSTKALIDAINKNGHRGIFIDPAKMYFDSIKKTVYYEEQEKINLRKVDAIIVKKLSATYSVEMQERLIFLKFLKNFGVKIFSNPSSIHKCYDRLSNTLTLQHGDIPMPETIITESIEEATKAVKQFKKAVFKPLYSTKARGMTILTENDEDLVEKVTDFKENGNMVMYIQKKINLPGKDLGVAFLGGKYLATYARVGNEDSWNTTILAGGKYQEYTPGEQILNLADKAQKLFGLDFTCVDVVESENGLIVFEVSAFGGFRGLLEGCKIDAADLYVKYVLNQI